MSPDPSNSTASSAALFSKQTSGTSPPGRRERRLIGGLALVLALTLGGAGWWGAAPLASLDAWLLDQTLLHTLPAPESSSDGGDGGGGGHGAQRTAVVDIDEVSLAAVGQWPWPRYRVAALIQRVAAAQPAAIGLDILFPEADRSSLANIQQTFKNDFGIDMQFSGVPAGLLDNDGFLASVMARTAVVGSHYYYFDHVTRRADGRPTPAGDSGLTIEGGQQLPDLPIASGLMDSAPLIAAGTRSSGFVNNRLDRDGTLRRLPMLIRHGESVTPSLSLATAMRAAGAASAAVFSGPHGASIQFGSQRVPVDARGQATLRFEGASETYASVPALEVLNGRVDPAFFRDRVVFIGSTAAGINDIHATAVDARFPGLKIHAVAVGNMLGNRFVEHPRWAGGVAFVACLGVGATVAALFTSGVGAGVMLAGAGGLALLLGGASLGLFMASGLFVSPGAPLALVLALVPVGFMVRFTVERQRAARFMAHLATARQVTMESMAAVAETRDPETGAHIKRTQHYVRAVALELRRSGHHLQTLNTEYIELLFLSAPLHDIGKVGIPDHILLKPGRLTPEEMVLMKTHAGLGRQIMANTAGHIAGDNFLVVAGEIAATHHEKWDGSGYPSGLAGEAIPLAGRIMAVADIYDALISRRCYKEPFPHAVATAMMRELRGGTFDPTVLDAFFRVEAEIQRIAARFRDADEDHAAEAGDTPAQLTAKVVRRLTDPQSRAAGDCVAATEDRAQWHRQ
ncbi:MAG: CHASE2 domain-containing protein [Rubrivivax sp.]